MKATDLPLAAIVLQRSNFKESWQKRKGFSKIRALLPPLIRLFTGGYYNHSYVVGSKYILDPDYPKCVAREKQWAQGHEVEVWVQKDKKSITSLAVILEAMDGIPYSLLDVLFFQLIYQLTGRRLWLGPKFGNARRKIICSEGVCLPFYYQYGWFPDCWKYDPEQLRKELPRHFECIFVGKLA